MKKKDAGVNKKLRLARIDRLVAED